MGRCLQDRHEEISGGLYNVPIIIICLGFRVTLCFKCDRRRIILLLLQAAKPDVVLLWRHQELQLTHPLQQIRHNDKAQISGIWSYLRMTLELLYLLCSTDNGTDLVALGKSPVHCLEPNVSRNTGSL